MQFLRSKNNRSEELQEVLASEHELAAETDSATDEAEDTDRPRLATDIDLDGDVGQSSDSRRTLSTFAGVFCPVALSQFSTLLFMRMGFVIGQSGTIQFGVELVLAYLILLLTILSICAISTNGEIAGGGVYFMISRTLGPEFGGSIGLLFFIANIFACGLYVSGFTESLVDNFGPNGYFGDFLPSSDFFWKYLYSLLVLLLCLGVCLVGSSLFARTSAVILLVLLVSCGSVIASLIFHPPTQVRVPRSNRFAYDPRDNASLDPNYTVSYNFTGPRLETFLENAWPHYGPDYTDGTGATKDEAPSLNFARIFAVLFSSVTGIMNGANLSGELRRPSRSIPLGTLLATLFTFITYLLLGMLISASCQYDLLLNNYGFLSGINYWAPFVFIGVSAATLSAALGNLIGASRILAALAKDGLFGPPLRPAAITTKSGNPVPAVLLSFLLVLTVLLIGSLNAIAPIVSCFFLLSYASTNLACAALDLAGAPNFRPAFKLFHWGASLAGLVGCLIMSFLISLMYTPISLMLLLGLIICLHLRGLPDSWGSITQALIYHQVRKYLLMLDLRKYHVKYWRPQILQLVANPRSSANAIQFVNHLKKGGLYVVGHVVLGGGESVVAADDASASVAVQEDAEVDDVGFEDPLDAQYRAWLALVDFLRVKAFVELTVAPTVRSGMAHLIRLSGLGGMKPNTVCVGFYDARWPVNALAFKQLKQRRQQLRRRFRPSADTNAPDSASSVEAGGSASSASSGSPTSGSAAASSGFSSSSEATLRHLPPIRSGGDGEDVVDQDRDVASRAEYVGMLIDVLRLGKDLLVTRGMDDAEPPSSSSAASVSSAASPGARRRSSTAHRGPAFIDVWPVNFLQPRLSGYMDTTCLLQLQFACILHTVRAWRWRSRLRVFLCVDSAARQAAPRLTESLDKLLSELRIRAQTHLLDWDQVLGENRAAATSLEQDGEITRQYLTAVNQTIRLQSPTTAAVFLYLPRPPMDPALHTDYLEKLDILTKDLPPTVMVHGLHKVVSRNL